MDKIIKKLFSMHAMAVAMLLFALSLAIATFVENDYGTNTAKALVYQARWFEFLLIYLVAILINNMIKFKMYKKPLSMKFIFHTAFIIIFVGAAVTRYFGFEGVLHIREGETENRMTSAVPYLQLSVMQNGTTSSYEKSMLFSKLSSNHFKSDFSNGKHEVGLELLEYVPSADYAVKEDLVNGTGMLELTLLGKQGREDITLKAGQSHEANGYIIDFGSKKTFKKPTIHLFLEDGLLYMKHNEKIETLSMDTRKQEVVKASDKTLVTTRILHTIGDEKTGTRFVLRNFYEKASQQLVSMEDKVRSRKGMRYPDALRLKVTVKDQTKTMLLFGQANAIGESQSVEVAGLKIDVSYGSKIIKLPFAIHLKDFELERYPGSNAPSSYASDVILLDKEAGLKEPYRIYMNHVLDHRGYRLFQSSYDQDELGTVLSVNYDFWGTWITYVGYILLAFGLFGSFFTKKGRFNNIKKELDKIRQQRAALPAILAAFMLLSFSPVSVEAADKPIMDREAFIKALNPVDADHAKAYGHLLTQGPNGRLQPMELLSRDILRKISKRDTFEKLPAMQVVLSMMSNPNLWQNIPIIKVDNKDVAKRVGLESGRKYASLKEFYPDQMQGAYLLEMDVADARQKAPKKRGQFDKALLKIDERVHITQMVFQGLLFKIFPKENDVSQKWYDLYAVLGELMRAEQIALNIKQQAEKKATHQSARPTRSEIEAVYNPNSEFTLDQAITVKNLFYNYFVAVEASSKSGDWKMANDALAKVKAYQKFAGAAIYPDDYVITLEILYNNLEIFHYLMIAFLIIGLWLLVTAFVGIIKPKLNLKMITKIGFGSLFFFFVIYTLGLVARWIISGHAPWSNGYEALVFIGWATLVAGFLVSKNSLLALSATAILAGITLGVAEISNFDPQITNLVPVLKSYWLTIHVSMITSSYGFLGLAFLLGFISLILFISLNSNNAQRISLTVKELNRVAEMAVLMGLVLLTVGNFLGGVWANESWGRYWGWDAKETWALISILIYAVVAHLRYVPKMYTDFRYAVILVVSYSSILMTFFGVNFYLSGLHSYAKGDPVPIPTWVYYAIATVIIMIIVASLKRQKFIK